MPPAAPDPHPHAGIRLDVPHVRRPQAVLGDDPQGVALERLSDRHLARLAAAASGGLEQHVTGERKARPSGPPH